MSAIDPNVGGPVAALIGLSEAQLQSGLNVSVATTIRSSDRLDVVERLRGNGIEVTTIGPCITPLAWHPKLARSLRPLIEAADVIHIHGLWEEIQYRAARQARTARKPYIFRPCGMLDPWSLGRRALKKRLYLALRLRRLLNRATAMHYNTPMEEANTVPVGLSPPTIVEPNGVNLEEFRELPPPGSFRRKLEEGGSCQNASTRPLIAFMGRIHEGKGLEYLVPALAQMKRSDAVLVIIGPDPRGFQKEIEKMVDEHNQRDRVIFAGMLHGAERNAALADADIFALPSDHENFGVAVVEALACGTPVIVSDQVAIARQIADAGVGGIAERDPERLGAELDAWLNDDARRLSAAERTRPFVWEQYDWTRIAERWVGHYERLCKAAAGDGRG